jgi:hypothetical protein
MLKNLLVDLVFAALKYLPGLLNQLGISEVVNVVQEPVDKVKKKPLGIIVIFHCVSISRDFNCLNCTSFV